MAENVLIFKICKKLIKEAVFINLEKLLNPPLKFSLAKNFLKSGNSFNRHYDPTVGRWTTKDPIGFAGGDTNLYAYVGGNSLSYIDPMGLSEQDVISIQNLFNNSVNYMNQNGLRRPGTGTINGILNNGSIAANFFLTNLTGGKIPETTRLGCGGQAIQAKDDISFGLAKTDDSWTFQLKHNLTFSHWWVEGVSSNKNDPVLTIDPWLNSFGKSK